MDYATLIKSIKAKSFQPIYLLHGEEPYFVDALERLLIEHALEEHERDFNQTVVYGRDVDVTALIGELKAYPMMAERRLVVLREAQDLSKEEPWELLGAYFEQPSPTTTFVISYKYKKFDSRKKSYKALAKNGCVFLSEKIKDYALPKWVEQYVASKNFSISQNALSLLVESLGNDLSKIVNELDKLSIILQEGTAISEIHIEENIGISREYNPFELSNALRDRNVEKAFKIVHYFEHHMKSGELIPIVATLFSMYTKMLRAHFEKDSNPNSLAGKIGVHPFAAKEMLAKLHLNPPKKLAACISILHEYDLKSKGVGNSGNSSDGMLLREMVFKLLHA
jgi:DNA polymerase III subunit delta